MKFLRPFIFYAKCLGFGLAAIMKYPFLIQCLVKRTLAIVAIHFMGSLQGWPKKPNPKKTPKKTQKIPVKKKHQKRVFLGFFFKRAPKSFKKGLKTQ